MSLLERIVIAHRCRSTHHYIAMDALPLIAGPDAEKWRNLMLVHNEELLKGAKAPDAVFRDFKNHVLHVGEGEWGGARDAAMAWYGEAIAQLQNKKWGKAVYALGVLSHYYADPLQPFHTGQTEEEGAIHRAVEWSIAKSRAVIKERVEEIGYPNVSASEGLGFVSDMVRAGAEKSHPHYHTMIDHYNLDAGVKNPPAGLDQNMIDIVAELVAHATAGLGVLFSRAFAEAGVAAPNVSITVPGYLATLDIPVHWIAKKLDDASDKRTVTAMYREFKKTGKVIKTLPDDDKQIRKLHAREVMRRPLKELDAQELKPLGQAHEPRPQYAEFAKEIAESFATEPDVDVGTETEPVEIAPVIEEAVVEVEAKPAKKKKNSKKKRVRVVADTQESSPDVDEAVDIAAIEAAERKAEEAAKRAEQERADAEELARLDAAEAERAELERLEIEAAEQAEEEAERLAAEEAAQAEMECLTAQEAKQQAAEAKAKLEAQEALRIASDERAEKAVEEKARLEAEELVQIEAEEAERLAEEEEAARAEAKEVARFEAREAAEFARLEAEETAKLEQMEADRLAAEQAAEDDTDDEKFSLEELAAFDSNLTEDGDAPIAEAPPVDSFFEAPDGGQDSGRSRTRLMPEDPVIDAPSIGKKTARRLNRVGIFTVEDLLNCDVEEIAFELDVRHIDEPTLEDWKSQSLLMIEVPGLRIHDAQILVGAGVRSAEDLANASATKVFHASMGFLKTNEGARIVRDDHVLRETEVNEWIDLAKESEVA